MYDLFFADNLKKLQKIYHYAGKGSSMKIAASRNAK